VAATLRRLRLHFYGPAEPSAVACHELGVAIGKLRCLRYLSLDLFKDGRAHQAVGRGLAASGGCPPLFELRLCGVEQNTDCLIVPSVRRLFIGGAPTGEEALLLYCGLVQMGYKHRLSVYFNPTLKPPLCGPLADECMTAVLQTGGITRLAWHD
jgi:hypothetical protein